MRRKKWLELGKDVLLVLLALTLAVLTILALPAKTVTDTPWLAALVRPFASVMGLSQGELLDTPMADTGSVTGASQPIAVSVRNPAGRTSFQYDFSALDAAFEQFGAALGQALETAEKPVSGLAASWLHVESGLDATARWFILASEDTGVVLYLVGDELFSSQTQMSAEELEQLLQSCTPDGSFFAFESSAGYYAQAEPLSLLPSSTPAIHEVQTANPCDARFSDTLASTLGFNPYGDARYTDDAGNTTYTETGYALSIEVSGRLELRSDGTASRFQAQSTDPAELVECARSLLASMTSGVLADARLYLTEFRQDGADAVCTFDYCLGGIPLVLSGGHAAQVRFSGASVTQASLLLKTYTRTTQTLSVLPPAQAAAILPAGSDMRLVYSDSGSGVTAGWQS